MAESPLSLKRNDLRFRVGWYLGYGTNYDAMMADQQEVVDYCISSGLRKFYFPEPVDGKAHQWSFMRPWRTVVTTESSEPVPLTSDIAGIDGNLFFDPSHSIQTSDGVEQVSYHKIRKLRQSQGTPSSGYPRMAALEVEYPSNMDDNETTVSNSTSYKIHFWPTPDNTYTLHFQAVIRPDYAAGIDSAGTDVENRYLLGSAEHSETILAACLSVAEQFTERRDRQEEENFQKRLKASIEWDRQAMSPEKQGYMIDPSDNELEGISRRRFMDSVTYNDTLYTD